MNQQINGMNQRSIERKRIHKCVVFLCIITLIFHITFSTRIQARAASEAIALTMAALPLTWELVVPIMIAGGIGTAVWWATRTDVERGEIVNGIKERLLENGKTLVNKYANVWNGIDYIEGAIHDGLLYIGEQYLAEFWGYAQDNNLLGGESVNLTMTGVNDMSGWTNPSIGLTSSNLYYSADVLASMQSNGIYAAYGLSTQQYDALISLLTASYGMLVTLSLPNWGGRDFRLLVLNPNLILDKGYYFNYWNGNGIGVGTNTVSFAGLSFQGSPLPDNELNKLGTVYTVTAAGAITATAYSSSSIYFSVRSTPNTSGGASASNNWVSNVGIYEGSGTIGAPVGELGQVTDNNGTWEQPWIDGLAKALADYGVGYPVSYGGEIGATWDPSIPLDIDISLPYPDVINPDWDYAGTQADAQAGEFNPPKPIEDEDSLTYPGISGYMPPTGLQSKFPFCIPFDIKAFIALFVTSELTHAPRFVVPLNFSEYGYYEVTIDFTPYDPAAQLFRWLYLALFCIGIITKFDPFTHEV